MKKLSLILTASVFLFSACNLSLPQDVTVKTDAKYEFALGDVGHDFNDSFDKAKLFEAIETNTGSKVKVYDYFPGEKDKELQQFIVTVPIGEIDLPGIIQSNLPAGTSALVGGALSSLYEYLNGKTISSEDSSADVYIPGSELIGSTEVEMDISTIFSALDVLGDEFKTKTGFYSVPIYIYSVLDSGIDDFELTGSLVVKYKKEDGSYSSKETTLKPAPDDGDIIKQVVAPVLYDASGEAVSDSSAIVVTDVSNKEFSLTTDLAEFANENKSTKGKLEISYNLGMNGKFNGEAIGKISLNAYLVMPLEFTVNTSEGTSTEPGPDLKIDVIALAKQDQDEAARQNSDIFNRDKATDLSDIQKYIDIIDKATINYTIKDLPVSVDRTMEFMINSVIPKFEKSIDIDESGVTGDIDITGDEVIEMLETYPYTPDVYLSIPDDSVISLPRDIQLEMNMDISLKVNGELKF